MQVANLDTGLRSTRFAAWVSAHRRAVGIATTAVVASLGFAAVDHLVGEMHGREIGAALESLTPWQIGSALGLTAISYVLLTLYDVIALRVIGKPLPYRTAALASFTSYSLSHNLGLGLITGGSARLRVYSAAGLPPADVARVIAAASLAFWMGVLATTSVALLVHPDTLALGPISLGPTVQRALGVAGLAALAAALAFAGSGRRMRLFGWTLPIAGARHAALQTLIAAADLLAASAALLVLLPGANPALLPTLFLVYALAMLTALVTHVPGGLGVFEAVILAVLPQIPTHSLVAALIAYRMIYYLLPLGLAVLLMAIHEGWRWRSPIQRTLDGANKVLAAIAPPLLSMLAFCGGLVLLVSGALPAIPGRLHDLRALLPLPFVEASQIAASLAGTGLLLLAPGLFRRLDGAFHLTRALLIGGIAFSLAKGFDYEEALALSGIALILQWARPSFYRRTALTAELFSPGWLLAIAFAVGLSAWIGMFAYRHIDYDDKLWWHFAWSGDASRFLRATFGAAVLLLAAIFARLMSGSAPRASAEEIALPDQSLVAGAGRTDAFLALTGDKRFWRGDGGALLMYQIQGDSWIVMGDPIGPQDQWPDLAWSLRERVDAAQGRLLLYQITRAMVPIAIDLGLALIKYGEEALVDLDTFDLEGPTRKPLRYATRRAEREGAVFEIVQSAQVPALLSELRAISDAWLSDKGHSEKAFSVGRFDEDYLARFDCALIRWQGRIVAFANILATANKEELSIDLMRHLPKTPYGTMDFLFARLMLWGRDEGVARFNLGLAPLSGISDRRLAPIWARAGGLLYRHGDSLYGFDGLRIYKEKFAPFWEPRYIAGPHGLGMARALIDLQTLISGRAGSAARLR